MPTVSIPAAPPASLAANEVLVGSALFAAMGSVGAVAVTRDDDVLIAPLRGSTLQPFSESGGSPAGVPFALVDGSPSAAYWISKGRLVRRKIAEDGTVQALEVLATNAAEGTRVSAARVQNSGGSDVVVYIGGHVSREMERAAQVWVERHGSRKLSSEAGGATSAAIVSLGGSRFAVLTLDGRTAMSPVHATSLELEANGAPHLGEDRVVFVAGPAERNTTITGVQSGPDPIVFLAISKDTTQFGLLSLRVGFGDGEAPSFWIDYPNGIDPAPVATTVLCGTPRVLFVRPESASPKARRVLEIGRVDPEGKVVDRKIIAQAASFRSVSAAPVSGSAAARSPNDKSPAGWVAYVTEAGVVAQSLQCR